MEPLDAYLDEELSAIVDVLDTVKAARHQLGTLSHMSEGLEGSVEDLKAWLRGVQLFFSDRRRVALTAASIILVASLINLLRGWAAIPYRHGAPRRRDRKRSAPLASPAQTNRGT